MARQAQQAKHRGSVAKHQGFGGKSKNHGDRKNFGRNKPKRPNQHRGHTGTRHGEQSKPTNQNFPTEFEGVIKLAGRKGGFVDIPDSESEVQIEPNFLHTALHGDTVAVRLHAYRKGHEQTGEVVKIIARARSQFVGTVSANHFTPDDRRMYLEVVLQELASEPLENKKVLVEITDWQSDPLKAKLLQVLGKQGEHETEIRSILAASGIQYDFPEQVEKEALEWQAKYPTLVEPEAKVRRDMRDVPTFTIDPKDAKDFDDAISFKELPTGKFEIGIHIADVSYFVRPGTSLDTEGSRRANSVYLVDRTIPMLPEALSADICSLVPDQDRFTYSCVLVLDKSGKVESEWFGRTVIHSDKRFTYEEAAEVLDTHKGPYVRELETLNTIAKELHKERVRKGSVIFEKDEVKIELGPDFKPIRVSVKERLATHKLVEEFMLLANKHVAHYLFRATGKLGGGAVYRIHDTPDPDRIELLRTFLRSLGYKFEGDPKKFGAKEINQLFLQIKGEDVEALVQTAVLRSMAKAVYSVRNIGHFGLGFEYYTHFTSPIRRYPDVLVHRLLTKYLSGKALDAVELANFERIAKYSSTKEKEAADAERESIKFKQAEYMAPRIGQEFDGLITGVTEWGIYVEEQTTKCEGMVRLSSLADDFYEFNENKFALVGKRTKKVYRLGDKLRIKLSEVDVQRHQLTWTLA